MPRWSDWTIEDKSNDSASAGTNNLQFDIKDGQLAQIVAVELKNNNKHFVSAYVYFVNSGKPLNTTDALGITGGFLLPSGAGNTGTMLAVGKWYARKAIVGVIKDCEAGDVLRLKMQIRYKDLR